jgi:hypothetical protein
MKLNEFLDNLNERDAEIIGTKPVPAGREKGPTSDKIDQKKINAVMLYLNANKDKPGFASILKDLAPENYDNIDMVSKNPADAKSYGTVEITTDSGKKYVANFDKEGNCISINKG